MPDRRILLETRDRVDEIGASFERTAHRLGRVIAAQSVYLVAMTAVLVAIVNNIQHDRRMSILQTCRDINQRNERTIAKLDAQLAHVSWVRPSDAARVRERRAFTVSLINQLTPKQDCRKLANQRVKGVL